MRAKQWIPKLVAAALIAAYLLFMPEYLDEALKTRTYDEKFSPEEEPYTGILTVWHVVGFKPHSGSLGTALTSIAKGVERKHYGVFFDVVAMDEAEYAERIARGETPDLISFPLGLCYPEQLSALDAIPVEGLSEARRSVGTWEGTAYALPYAMSAHVLLVNTGLFQERGAALPEGKKRDAAWISEAAQTFLAAQASGKRKQLPALSGNAVYAAALGLTGEVAEYDVFKAGNAAMAVADLRAASELQTLQTAGKGFAFEASVLPGGTSLVQMIGLANGISAEKRPYALALIECLFSENAWKQLSQRGLIAMTGKPEEAGFENTLVAAAAESMGDALIPNAFLLQRYHDALEETARRALTGDEEAQKDLAARLKELVSGMQIK
jgi:hypothetical protein